MNHINLNDKKGITLFSVTISILVLIIIVTMVTHFGMQSLNRTTNAKLYSNLTLLMTKIEEYKDKNDFNNSPFPGKDLDSEDKAFLNQYNLVTANTDLTALRRIEKSDLEAMGLPKSILQTGQKIYVDYKRKEIISTKGYIKQNNRVVFKYSSMKKEVLDEKY